MNIQSMKYLVALVRWRNFGKAAKMCFVSQPTLSTQIKKLEEYLGVQLIERTNKSFHLTSAGEIISRHAENILRELTAIRETAKSLKDPFAGEIKIGIIPTAAPYLLPKITFKLRKFFPHLNFFFLEKQTQFLLDDLQQCQLDTAILALPVNDSSLSAREFFQEEFLVAVAENHALAKRKIIKQSDLSGKKILLLDDGHCFRDQALAVCHQANAFEIQDFRATSLETLRQIIALSQNITLMPKLAYKKNDGLCYINFSSQKPYRSLGLVWRQSSGRTLLFNTLADHLHKICNDPDFH